MSVHEKSLELMKNLIDVVLIGKREGQSDIKDLKMTLLLKVLHCVALKFGEIYENFTSIRNYIKNIEDA